MAVSLLLGPSAGFANGSLPIPVSLNGGIISNLSVTSKMPVDEINGALFWSTSPRIEVKSFPPTLSVVSPLMGILLTFIWNFAGSMSEVGNA